MLMLDFCFSNNLQNATGLDPGATIFEICAVLDEQGLDIPVVRDGLEVTLVPIVEGTDIQISLNNSSSN